MTVPLFAAQPQPTPTASPLGVSTPILVAAGGLIVANADGPSGLLPGLIASIQQPDGTVVVPSDAVTITEAVDLGGGQWRYQARAVAPTGAGSYMIVWSGPQPNETATEPIIVTIGVRPGVTEVAAFIRARTKIKGGSELGTFSAATRPTDQQVETFIDFALDDVLGKVQPVDSTLTPGTAFNAPGSPYETRIRGAVALYAAILSETSLQPEQVANNQSAAQFLQTLYEARIRALISEGETGAPQGMGEGASGSGDSPGDAYYAFPDCTPVPLTLEQLYYGSPAILPPGQIGLSTQW